MVPLPKKDYNNNFKGHLAGFTYDCPDVSPESKLVTYDKKILSKFILAYNQCKSLHLPMLNYGFFAGIVHTKPIENKKASEVITSSFTYNPENNPYFGFFLDSPISATDFSVYLSIGFFRSSYSSSLSTYDYDAGILIKQSTLIVPLLIRYTLPAGKIKPYINIGLNYLYNLRNENMLYKASTISNITQFDYIKANPFSDSEFGCVFGTGIQYKIDFKMFIFLELRLSKEFTTQSESMYNLNLIELTSGINF
jgi:hypothetical protein